MHGRTGVREKDVRRGGRRRTLVYLARASWVLAAAAVLSTVALGAQRRGSAAAQPTSRPGLRRAANTAGDELGERADDVAPVAWRTSPLRDELLRARVAIRAPREPRPVARAGGSRP